MNELFKLLGRVGVDTSDAEKKIDSITNKAKGAADKFKQNFGNISQESASMAGKIALGLGTAALAIGSFSIKAAGDMQAMNSQFTQVFGKMEGEAIKRVNSMAKEFNMVPNRIKPMFSKMTSMFMGLGMDTKQAMGEAEKATRMTADAAAFYDTSFEDANAALSSFIKGNYEGGEAIGIFANDTQMAAYAVKKGVVDSTKEWANLDEATKQATRLEYAQNMQKLGGVTGQAAREAKGMENVMGNLKQSVTDLAAAFGAPLLQPFLNTVNMVSGAMSKLAGILQANPALIYAIIGAVTTLATAFTAVYVAGNKAALIAQLVSKSTALFGAMANPVFLVVAAIGALVTAFVYFYNTSKPFKDFIDNLVPTIKDGLVTAFEWLKKAIDQARPALEAVKETLGGAFASALPVISGLLDQMGGAFGKVGTVAGIVVSILSKVALAALGITGPWGMAVSAVVAFLTAWAKTGEINADGITMVFDNLTNLITNFSTMLNTYLPQFITVGTNLILKLAEGIVSAMPMIASTINTIIMTLTTTLVTVLPQISAAGTQIITMLISGISLALPLIIAAMLQIVITLINALIPLLPQLIAAGIQIVTALINGIVQILPAIINVAIQLITLLTSTLIGLLPQLITAGIKILTALINGIVQVLPTLINAAVRIISALVNAIAQNLPKIIAAGIKILLALIAGIMQILPQLISAALRLIVALASALIRNLPRIISAGVQILGALVKGILQVIGQLGAAALKLIAKLFSSLVANSPKILSAGVQLVQALIRGLGQLLGAVGNAAVNLGKAAIQGVKGFASAARDAGVNLAKGFANGIGSMVSSVVGKAQELGSKAVGAVKKFLNIHSPSRVMMELGVFTGQGFANGIENMQSQVQAASDELAKAALIDPTLNDGTLQQGFDVSSATPVRTFQTDTVDAKWSNLSDTLEQVLDYLARLLDKSTDVYLNGKRVGQLIEPDVSDNQLRNNILNERGVYNGGI